MRRPVIAGIIFFAVFVAILVYSTLNLTRHRQRVEVCMQYQGRNSCRVASGATQDEALRAAVTNACALIAGGVTESQQCESSTPVSIKWLNQAAPR